MSASNPKHKNNPKRRKRKLKKKVKVRLVIFLLLIVTSFILYFPLKLKANKMLHPAPIGTVKVDRYRDLNPLHLGLAKRNGISAIKTNKDFAEGIDKLLKDDQLVEISDNSYYRVCHLTHSHPYLTPAAKQFLIDLGEKFRKKLDEKDMPDYYFQISSLLRTQENQKKLSRSNGNASPNTSHLYGTTFDIPYSTLIRNTLLWYETEVADGSASKILSEAIGELRDEGRCVVVTEKKERCFHITIKIK